MVDRLSLIAPWPSKLSKNDRVALKIRGELLHAYTMLELQRWFLKNICASSTDHPLFFWRQRLDGDERSCPKTTNADTHAVLEDRYELLLETR